MLKNDLDLVFSFRLGVTISYLCIKQRQSRMLYEKMLPFSLNNVEFTASEISLTVNKNSFFKSHMQ